MNWSNVRLILEREIRDQLRDRRTMFMIVVLPILLYPLLGMSLFQVAQFVREHATQVWVVGGSELEGLPPLIENGRFAAKWFSRPETARLLELKLHDPSQAAERKASSPPPEASRRHAEAAVKLGECDVAVYFPPNFAEQINVFRQEVHNRNQAAAGTTSTSQLPKIPPPEVFFNTAKERSRVTLERVTRALSNWRNAVGEQNLRAEGVPPEAAQPFEVDEHDVADKAHRDAAVWSKVLPFLVLIWTLTGAFYPAIDLCAGEKERGTLETLLSSPAKRHEIVWGKLLTIMLFSMATATLNLASMGVTGAFVLKQLQDLGPSGSLTLPPWTAMIWLAITIVPVSALFSALCLALAAFARSTKEGQYYLMPVLLVTMPLVILPMAPGVELTLGNSLIPITGVVLLVRTLLEGNYAEASLYVPPVLAVTLGCCWLAIRWAVDQFNTEKVLFRDSERFDVWLWLKHVLRDRDATPSAAEAVLCGTLILLIEFFLSLALSHRVAELNIVGLVLVTQFAAVLTPTLLMTAVLTRSPRQTLLLRMPKLTVVAAAAGLAACLHPAVVTLQVVVLKLYPLSQQAQEQLQRLSSGVGNDWQSLLLVALIPPLCEELAFRGFILSGLRHLGDKWRAILFTSIFFGLSHPVFQQSIIAALVGIVIGYVAVQTGSILPCMAFHLTHNALQFLWQRMATSTWINDPAWSWIVRREADGIAGYSWPVVLVGIGLAGVLCVWISRLQYLRTVEEALTEAIHQHRSDAPSA